jgi:hypothetical protein
MSTSLSSAFGENDVVLTTTVAEDTEHPPTTASRPEESSIVEASSDKTRVQELSPNKVQGEANHDSELPPLLIVEDESHLPDVGVIDLRMTFTTTLGPDLIGEETTTPTPIQPFVELNSVLSGDGIITVGDATTMSTTIPQEVISPDMEDFDRSHVSTANYSDGVELQEEHVGVILPTTDDRQRPVSTEEPENTNAAGKPYEEIVVGDESYPVTSATTLEASRELGNQTTTTELAVMSTSVSIAAVTETLFEKEEVDMMTSTNGL